jgi:putative isomerase
MKMKNCLVALICISNVLSVLSQTENLNFDISRVPFSIKGSWLAISSSYKGKGETGNSLFIRDISSKYPRTELLYKIDIIDGEKIVEASYKASPNLIEIQSEKGKVLICFEDVNTIRIKSENVKFRAAFVHDDKDWAFTIPNDLKFDNPDFRIFRPENKRSHVVLLSGKINTTHTCEKCNHDIVVTPENGKGELVLEAYESEWVPRKYSKTFEQCVIEGKKSFNDFYLNMPPVPQKYENAAMLATYVDWSCIVSKRSLMTRDGMLMSKNWMNKIWSWDHCFNAVAMSYSKPNIAWDQFMIMFDHQDDLGNLPDIFSDVFLNRGTTKPPVHGWAFKKLMKEKQVVTPQRLKEGYKVLSKLTNFWMQYRDYDHNGIPQYNHGWDGGWDNATVFDIGFPVESPDLSAFLVYQMDILSDVAKQLNLPKESKLWKQKSDTLLDKFIKRLWNGEEFLAKIEGTETYNKKSVSLVGYMPIILGKRLPSEILNKLIAGLKKPEGIVTNYGPASESPKSELYESDGYWRGPIWAPTTLLIIEGLNNSGEKDLAKEIARKFCDMCIKSGFGENYDAVTGEARRDPAYTWTSSVFLTLIHDYLVNEKTSK